jgi:hypothetical protein
MNDNMCEKCKYRDVLDLYRPCSSCKYSFPRGTYQFDNNKSFFESEREEAAPAEVDHPTHYAGKFECIDVMLDTMGPEDVKGFCLCNAFKYLWRCKKKHETPEEDVEKAVWYLQKYLELGGKT